MQETTYKRYVLYLLMMVLAFNQLDRFALGILLQDIKLDLHLTDTQLGFLTGIAFALFYAVMGIPLARWADRGNRVTILSLTAAVWSVAVALCGTAVSALQLMGWRVLVAVGEAGCMPPAHSLIADEFPREERPRAVARYMLGVPLALTFGFFAAGWLNELYGWRATFVIMGLPGVALAALVRFTLREPRESQSGFPHPSTELTPSLREVARVLFSNHAFRHLLICFSVWFFFAQGIVQWLPTFFIRSHGLKSGELGTWFGLIWGVIGGVGLYAGGELAVRCAGGDERRQLRGCAVAFCGFALLTAATFVASNQYWAFAALALAAFGGNLAQAPIFATTQTLVPPRLRAMSIALVYLFANLIGMGLGPLAAGLLSDGLRPWFGEESLRYALAILCPGYFWAAWHLWRASDTVERDVKAARAAGDAPNVLADNPSNHEHPSTA